MKIDPFLNTGTDYLKKEDFPQPALLTISGAEQVKVLEDDKIVIHFKEDDKALLANKTNLQLMAVFYGSTDTDDWIGHKVVLYNDPTVMYAGKVVGGIRVRLPKGVEPIVAQNASREPGSDDFDDDVPF
jgi:hypothetical protein